MYTTAMTSSNPKLYTRIIYHTEEQFTDQFNDQTTMNEIHEHVRKRLDYCLRNPYYIQFRHRETSEMKNLNQNVLNYEYNPFKMHSSINHTDSYSEFDMVELYVFDYLPVNPQTNQQSNIVGSGTTSLPRLVVNESECQQDLFVKSSTITRCISHADDLSGAMLIHEPPRLPVNNDRILERALVGNTFPIQTHSLILNQNSSTPPSLNESDRLCLSRDVKPVQKPIYMSDQFNQRHGDKINGLVAYIQGVKTVQPARSSVLPKIRVPCRHRNKRNAWLDVRVVYQKKLANGKICWIKHPNKGFLPKVYERDTLPVNPISFPLDSITLSKDGDFELSLRMTTKWNKSGAPEEVVYQLDEQLAKDLHPVMDLEPNKYDPLTPRLMGSIREGNVTRWDTVCLSDYMRSTIACKRAASSTNITGQNMQQCKRLTK